MLSKNLNHDKGSNIDNLTTSPIRTYPEHQFFAERGGVGQEALFNVMKAYSVHDREVLPSKLVMFIDPSVRFVNIIKIKGGLLPRVRLHCRSPPHAGCCSVHDHKINDK